MTIRSLARIGLLGLCVALVGCSGDETSKQISAMNTSNIQRLANMYAGHQNSKSGAGPKDEAAFKEFIKVWDPTKLSAMNIDPANLDKTFTSERDGKPFKIRYGVGGGRGSVDAVVFETEGKDGKKQVGYTGGKVEEVDDATYKDLFAGKKSGSAPSGPPTGPNSGGRPTGAPPGAPTGPPK
jgi:hypothetical protein